MFEDFYLNIQLLTDDSKMPIRAHSGDAGMDVYTPNDIIIEPWSDVLVGLGWCCEFPKGYALIVKEKSGIATKKKLDIGAAVIDEPYKGEVHVHLFNNSDQKIKFEKGNKIAQILAIPLWTGQPKQVNEINKDTSRGEGGFGSTGE